MCRGNFSDKNKHTGTSEDLEVIVLAQWVVPDLILEEFVAVYYQQFYSLPLLGEFLDCTEFTDIIWRTHQSGGKDKGQVLGIHFIG